jgi:hypothetical protein
MEGLAGARGAGRCDRATEVLDELSVRHAQRGRHRACHGVSTSKSRSKEARDLWLLTTITQSDIKAIYFSLPYNLHHK